MPPRARAPLATSTNQLVWAPVNGSDGVTGTVGALGAVGIVAVDPLAVPLPSRGSVPPALADAAAAAFAPTVALAAPVVVKTVLWIDAVHVAVAPPPFPDPLHCVIEAPVVFPSGLQRVVGAVPPPVPEPMHWFTVAPAGVTTPAMKLRTLTLHVTVPPPPLSLPCTARQTSRGSSTERHEVDCPEPGTLGNCAVA
jgi:hypothetical protein